MQQASYPETLREIGHNGFKSWTPRNARAQQDNDAPTITHLLHLLPQRQLPLLQLHQLSGIRTQGGHDLLQLLDLRTQTGSSGITYEQRAMRGTGL